MRLLYNLTIHLYLIAIKVAALFNDKAKKWLSGRKNIFKELERTINKNDSIIWFHVASLGEFEQGKPVIEGIKRAFPSHKILLTFFSPSGYEIRKSYAGADYIFYMPIDTKKNAKKFISIVNPKMAIFVKYEFWFNYINELYKSKIPLLMVSVIFRPSQHFFRYWGGWFRKQLHKVTWFYVQDDESVALLEKIKVYHTGKSGDTRFDRVFNLVQEKRLLDQVEQLKDDAFLVVAGSTWLPDEDILKYVISQSSHTFKLIIAPHVVSESHIKELQQKFKKWSPVLFTELNPSQKITSRILILNTTGILSYVYRYADFSYIGGGFGAGIHNLLEPATYGQPVIFGPKYDKFREANELINIGSGFPIKNKEDALNIFNKLLSDITLLKTTSLSSKKYIEANTGATQKVISKIKEYLIEPAGLS